MAGPYVFPYAPGPMSGNWAVALPGEASIGEVIVNSMSAPAAPTGYRYWPCDEASGDIIDTVAGQPLVDAFATWTYHATSLRGDAAGYAVQCSAPANWRAVFGAGFAWPAAADGNGIAMLMLAKIGTIPTGANHFWQCTLADDALATELWTAGLLYNAAGGGFGAYTARWAGSSLFPGAATLPAPGKRFVMMAGYKIVSSASQVEVTCAWLDEDGNTDASNPTLGTFAIGTYPPTQGRIIVATDTVGTAMDEFGVYLEPPSSTLLLSYAASVGL